MQAILYCPECRHEVLIENYTPPVHCGLCYFRFKRNVRLLRDPKEPVACRTRA